MSKNYALQAEARDRVGKGAARALRRENKVPAVIYGDGKEPITITLPEKEINLEYNKGHMFTTLCDLSVGSDKHLVLARDVQSHVVKGTVEHVDFLRVSPKTKIAVSVPVQFINEEQSPAIQDKGVMNIIRYEVELVCQATSIPDAIEIDLTPFQIGDTIKISNATMPAGAKPVIDDRDFTIAVIAAPRRAEATDDAAEGAEGEEAAAEAGEEKAEEAAAEE
ncbi:MAG: 50S ribosomal protein L25/general stress protein Ctc [Rhodospirillales bacterium]|nr:50S ribosomal protein L25/general stress protein Ctc [Rhodospirillales bacterium]MCB9995444.1 50S ribosomal protein L25/general stress protein Ctc [Rhodospirillales bacterium]